VRCAGRYCDSGGIEDKRRARLRCRRRSLTATFANLDELGAGAHRRRRTAAAASARFEFRLRGKRSDESNTPPNWCTRAHPVSPGAPPKSAHGPVSIEPVVVVDQAELLALYNAVGWTAYTRHPASLSAAIAGSSYVVTARRGPRLVGLARAVSDDATVCYLQDVLVVPDEQRSGIGRALVAAVLGRYAAVRQKVLLTDDEPGQRVFYESLGYREAHDRGLRAFVRFDVDGATGA
jgi:GNAT superfamily N-acetyltransferase